MPISRTCEACGHKMPFGRRRTRVDGKLLCDGCTPGKPGAPGRPIGYHGSKEASLPMNCETCGTPMGNGGLIRVAGKWACGGGCPSPAKTAAHATGDVPRFCPFDGSQQTVSNHDGSISCSWCERRYELRLAPSAPAMPQTVDGQQYQELEGPATDGDGFAPAEGAPEPVGEVADPGGVDEEGFAPAGSAAPDPQGMPFGASRKYRTESGQWVDEDAYTRHLAIATSRDRLAMAEQIRQSR